MSRVMKDSGIEWIGEMPKKWKVVTLGKVSSIQTGSTPSMQGDENYYENGEILWVKPDNLNSFIPIEKTKEKINHLGISKARIVPPNTPLICCIGSIGKFGYSQQSVAYNQQINSVDFDEVKVNWKYGLYYLSTQEEQHWYYSTGNVVRILNSQNQKQIKMPMPTLREQQQIANFLDQNVAEIDHIIDKTKESIDEYKKYKQSIITDAVTKGLKTDVKMKDSRVEHIGLIPIDWQVIKLKYLLEERKIKSITGTEEPLSMSQKYGLIKTKDMNMIPNMASSFIGNKHVEIGDLVFNKLKAHLGVFAVSEYNGLVSPDYAVYYKKNKNLNVKFLEYLFKTDGYINEFKKYSKGVGAGLTRLYTSELFNIRCSLPIIDEQNLIVEFINNKCKKIDTLIIQKEILLTELEIYKKSLIYECVTGKREV